jgi:pyridoxal phosphate enzyme (YggS family)
MSSITDLASSLRVWNNKLIMSAITREELLETIGARLKTVRDEIAVAAARSGRTAESVRLVAVTKTYPAPVLDVARALGLQEIGENYLREAEAKFQELGWPEVAHGAAPVQRHAIGHIQANKVALALRWFELIESVDSLALAQRIDRLAGEMGMIARVLLQVNISQDPQKFGFFSDTVEGLLFDLAKLSHIRISGLMTIGHFDPNPEVARADFAALRLLRDRLRAVAPSSIGLDDLSMGMSQDFAVAIEEGATIVRVGSRLFGSRISPSAA